MGPAGRKRQVDRSRFALGQDVIRAVLDMRARYQRPPREELPLRVRASIATAQELAPLEGMICHLASISDLQVSPTAARTSDSAVAKDISAARYTYELRAWTSDDDAALIVDEVITKGTQSSSGELDHYFKCGTTVRDTMTWQIVEVDNDNTDADTNTGKPERILTRWRQPIIDAP